MSSSEVDTIRENANANPNNKISMKLKYPIMSDSMLQQKIALKKEFQYKYDGSIKDIVEEDHAGRICNEIILKPHQLFVKSFISERTPYNGILLYHGMGSGKPVLQYPLLKNSESSTNIIIVNEIYML